jgi:hypothetical protein
MNDDVSYYASIQPPAQPETPAERTARLMVMYRELWSDFNATTDLIEKLNDHLRDIKARQRNLANQMVKSPETGQ